VSEYIRASRFLIAVLLALVGWAEIHAERAAAGTAAAPDPTPIRVTYAVSSRGSARPATDSVLPAGLLIARSQLLPPAPSPAPTLTATPIATPTPLTPEPQCLGVFKVTGYSDSPWNGTDGRGFTRSGERTHWGVVAVDPSVIPLGSRLTIEGMGGTVFTALDTGEGVTGRWVDVWFHTDSEALQHGVQERLVYLLPK